MIVCAAIRVWYISEQGEPKHAVFQGFRHSACWETMAAVGLPSKSERTEEEGFITNDGTFLTRSDAYRHALACGQISETVRVLKEERGERILFSEDLY